MSEQNPTAPKRGHGRLVGKLLVVAVAMFGFGVFAMPPLYDTFCEITGLGQAGIKTAGEVEESAAPRQVKVRFDANTNSKLDWEFRPVQSSMMVTTGEATTALYFAGNPSERDSAGMATFNVSPPKAARYFVKTECFCFTRQELAAGEEREMPVYFFLQPDLPEDIEELTLSYTFFRNEDDDVAQNAP